MDIIASAGFLFCKLIIAIGLGALAPGVCFGGDTTAIGLNALLVLVLAVVAASALGYRAAGSSSVVLIIVSLSVLAAGSAAIVHYFD
jgi:hypothetical protein